MSQQANNESIKVIPKRGMEFIHARWLDNQNNPLLCRITAIRKGMVYWRSVTADGSLGQLMCCELEGFPSKVKSVLDKMDIAKKGQL